LIFEKDTKSNQWRKDRICFSINGVGKTRYPYVKKKKLGINITTYTKINSSMDYRSQHKP